MAETGKNCGLCLNPWNYLNIEGGGDCFFCCSVFQSDRYNIGNIINQSFEEIWNGEKAKAFRKDVLERKYTHCKYNECKNIYQKYYEIFNKQTEIDNVPFPKVVQFSYDRTCEQKCIFCRDKIEFFTKQEVNVWNSIIDSKIIPLLANAEMICLNGAGEIFESEHTKLLLKKVLEKYENLKVDIFSNGVNFTKENIEKLNLTNKINSVNISMHSATEKTYKKIYGTNNFEKVKNNVKYLAQLKKEGKIKQIDLTFVINSVNYKDMKKMVKFAETVDLNVSFVYVLSNGNNKFAQNFDEYAIFKPSHYLYNKFVKLLKDPIFKSKHCFLNCNTNLQPISKIQEIKNKIKHITRKINIKGT